MNDNAKVSTFVGIPKTTTDRNGDESVYLSPAIFAEPTDPFDTFSIPSTKTSEQESSSTSSPTHAPSSSEDPSSSDTSTATNEPANQQKSQPANIGAIAGGVAAGVLILIALGVGGWIFKRKHDRKRHIAEHKIEEMQFLAMELDGSYNPNQKQSEDPLSEGSFFAHPGANRSITDDLASRYTGGSLSMKPPVLRDVYSPGAYPIVVGAELTMDSQGRLGMPDGSPCISDSILPLKNAKAADNYTDLEWFPLVNSDEELEYHPGPSYIEEKELSHVATYIQKTSGQKGLSPAGAIQRRF
ncbi:hypothetical protein H4R99_005958 [Coemansia sp. RSA 1722]|nr:hypothetical protein H4R99_005958 [Coemansia sp. RSA 1722]